MAIYDKTIKAPFGVIDMGSNGIRFGIVTDFARHLPVTYEERAPISLLEVQGEDHYIPSETIDEVITTFQRFKTICKHEGVDPTNVKVIATEATRIASNSKEFLDKIHYATGWTVDILSKEQEAIISSMGIIGSFYRVNGLTMDLGGGSVELNYVTSNDQSPLVKDSERPRKRFKVSSSPVSLPYGAIIMKNRLANCTNNNERNELYKEIVDQVKKAKITTNIPNSLQSYDGYTLYMSGGGFRALGYLSMAETYSKTEKGKYPIPIISGYSITGDELMELANKYKDRDPDELVNELQVFRISKRRARMIPAICFLVSAIMKVIEIKQIYFSEGGVRQGVCYYMLQPSEQLKDPLLEGVKSYVSPLSHALSHDEFEAIMSLLKSAIPPLYLTPDHPLQLHRLIPAAVHLANLTTHYPKETRAFVAFHIPLASGPLANVPGLLHSERAILALILAYRQGGEVPDPIFKTIENMIGKHGISVCKYIGKLMEIIFLISPRFPGLGALESGIKFHLKSVDSDDENSSPCSSPITPSAQRYYSPSKLEIILPEKLSPMLSAPSVISTIESMDKKIQPKSFELDEEVQGLDIRSKLFSVSIIRD
ncbi:Ppx/GppA phosphatase family-domain-containing protein [Cokeromyces recurvatus]|uniref:Ppx/GppA phosphatase family-domain-containing protein n=1 Tax=Cokeromyces recurvatus TaxID=90255 RepID=UPI00222095E0|nr:Ppx/GppA phosphatase family-domain-containing protein [Cokeromyces recurvatus]KAI7902007.1 Ppx/GppA phosphatase family-domain-containing protein [Cokeromyces recurvatus]